MTAGMAHVTHLTPGSNNPSREYVKQHQLMTAGVAHVTHLTPGSDNPKHGAPTGVDAKKAVMLLKGHKGAVQWVAFTQDSKGAVTVSKAGRMGGLHYHANALFLPPVTSLLVEAFCSICMFCVLPSHCPFVVVLIHDVTIN
jgi:hypothetical protein